MAIDGTNSANKINGTLFSNVINALGGNDTVLAFSGADTVFGGFGNDRISGGEGRDRLSGGTGDDVIFGFNSGDTQANSGSIVATQVGPATFDNPVFATSAPGRPDILFVVEQHTGTIRIVNAVTGALNANAFLDIADSELGTSGEQGLLGLAFHPDYASNGKLYVYMVNAANDIEVRAYQRSATNQNRADAASGNLILTIDNDNGAGNHVGGWIGFGPDGFLYINVGDEGLGGDPANNAQNKDELWGKVLRVDVNGDDFAGDPSRDYAIPGSNPFVGEAGADEIWALGLRNPWRASFDRLTGDFYIGDVGQDLREEINYLKALSAGGANFGWKVLEGTSVYDDSIVGNPPANSPDLTALVAEYGHDDNGGFAVTGGYVYRGPSDGMQGRYIYADYVSNKIWSLRIVNGKAVDVTEHTEQIVSQAGSLQSIASFAEDGRGNLYAISLGGKIFRLDFAAGAADGADFINGDAGNDKLYGGAGDDTIRGGADNDTLNGGAQDDNLNGGTGNDILRGGSGRDRFYFNEISGNDRIADFQNNIDTIRLGDDFGFTTVSQALALAVNVNGNVVFTFDGGQKLTIEGTNKAALIDDLLV